MQEAVVRLRIMNTVVFLKAEILPVLICQGDRSKMALYLVEAILESYNDGI